MWNLLRNNLWVTVIAASLAGLWTAAFANSLAAPSSATGQDCATRLSDPAPLSSPDREWLERCVSAFTIPTSGPTTAPPTVTSPPVTTWPTPGTTGVPVGWQPVQTRSTNLTVSNGAVVQDILFTNGADVIVSSGTATIRRVMFQGGRVSNPGCGVVTIDQTTFRRPSGTVTDADQEGAVTPGGWRVTRSLFDGVTEGLRAGQKARCGPNSISDSFIRVQAPDVCSDWHGDGIQGYDGGAVTVRNVTIDFQERGGCGGTAPFFYPRNQGNTSVDIDRLLVKGGGFSFRLGQPGTVRNLKIVQDWGYGPIDVRCSVVSVWSAHIVTVNSNWQPTDVRTQTCNTESGF